MNLQVTNKIDKLLLKFSIAAPEPFDKQTNEFEVGSIKALFIYFNDNYGDFYSTRAFSPLKCPEPHIETLLAAQQMVNIQTINYLAANRPVVL